MKTLRNLGLAALLTLAMGCGNDRFGRNSVTRNPNLARSSECLIKTYFTDKKHERLTVAYDTNKDEHFEEAFVTTDYSVDHGVDYSWDKKAALATTHYVAPGVKPEQQLFTGFADTKPMSLEYQRALQLVCNGKNGGM